MRLVTVIAVAIPALFLIGCTDDMDSPKPTKATAQSSAQPPFVVYPPLPPQVEQGVGPALAHPLGYIAVPEYRTVLVHLPALPSAGLTWEATDRAAFGDTWIDVPAGRNPRPIGAPTWQVLRFNSRGAGHERLRLRYGRLFDKDSPKSTYEFDIHTVASQGAATTDASGQVISAPPCDRPDCKCPKGPTP